MTPDETAKPATPEEVATSNPLGDALAFNLSMPTIEVRMVNAAGLEDYEFWFAYSSVLAAATVGFVVAYMQSFHTTDHHTENQPLYLVVAVIFVALFAAAAFRAWLLRRRLRREERTYAMRAVGSPLPQSE